MRYVWDENKRLASLAERGLDFAHAGDFDWATALTFIDERRNYGETRRVSIGYLNRRLVVLAYTYRESGCRIISMRKANRREQQRYEQWRLTSPFGG